MSATSYNKPPKTIPEQLQLLKDRGLVIDSLEKGTHLLDKLGYYRLSGYWYPLLTEPKSAHKFKHKANLQTAFEIYRFDRDLRILILKELEKIEIAVRAQMIYTLSHYKGCFWFSDPTIFANLNKHSDSINKLKQEFKKSDEEFVLAFKLKYSDPLPPSWMMLELTTFGSISMIYDNLKPGRSKRMISHHFGLDDATFSSWLHSLAYVRNVCAHHSRLWNRGMSIRPKIPLNPSRLWLENVTTNSRTYFVLSMILYLLQSVDIRHRFIFRLKVLLKKYPNIDVFAMGFHKEWKSEALWSFKPTLMHRLELYLTQKVK